MHTQVHDTARKEQAPRDDSASIVGDVLRLDYNSGRWVPRYIVAIAGRHELSVFKSRQAYESRARPVEQVPLLSGAQVTIVTEADELPLGATKQSVVKPGDAKGRHTAQANAFYIQPKVRLGLRLVPTSLWQADHQADSCKTCRATFTKLRRRHHCRGCGFVFCDSCCSTSADVPVRVCAPCRPFPGWRPVCFAVASPDDLTQNVRALRAIIDHAPQETAGAGAAGASGAAALEKKSVAVGGAAQPHVPSEMAAGVTTAASSGEESMPLELVVKLHAARKICDPDIMKYTMEWESTLQREPTAADELAAVCERVTSAIPPKYAGEKLAQPSPLGGCSDTKDHRYLNELKTAFDAHGDSIFDVAQSVAEKEGMIFKQGPPKKDQRSVEKADLAYDGDFAQLKDLQRASILCPTLSAVTQLLSALADTEGLEIVRLKNRFAPRYNAKEASAGYRDLQLNIVVPGSGLIWELQLHLEAMEKVKSSGGRSGHARYVAFRDVIERLKSLKK
jgi:hypothetical protein